MPDKPIPCPHCGSAATEVYVGDSILSKEVPFPTHSLCQIGCTACGARGPRDTFIQGAIQLWNRRADGARWKGAFLYLLGILNGISRDYEAKSVSNIRRQHCIAVLKRAAELVLGTRIETHYNLDGKLEEAVASADKHRAILEAVVAGAKS